MNLTLRRQFCRADGVFSTLDDETGKRLGWGLEHAYPTGAEQFGPKITPGKYACVRGLHRLADMKEPFQTFEIMGVAGHSNLLFHCGNFNKDSEGCILLGKAAQLGGAAGSDMVLHSKEAFADFMELQAEVAAFQLTVI